MNTLFLRVIRRWMPVAVGLSALCFIIYLVIQQNIRMNANDPQIQMAEDMANSLQAGMTVAPFDRIDVSKSIAPFTILYDRQGNVVSSSALLNGKVPILPKGVLSSSKGPVSGENRITWQPEDGVRLATVIVSYPNGYVVVGRNMREIEIRESQEFTYVFLGWIVSLIATVSCVSVMEIVLKKKK